MSARPPQRTIVTPNPIEVYIDSPDGLIYIDSPRTIEEARERYPQAVHVRALWDAPIIDPADPETYRDDSRYLSWP
jgi:hypothetical protein